MPILQPIIRPPAEADSVLIQVTTGCSANTCSFCGAYFKKPFRVKDFKEVSIDIQTASRSYSKAQRFFLMDGDALVLENDKLIPILHELIYFFPNLRRIASYANGYNITCRNDTALRELYENKLRLIYIGLESGNEDILRTCNKRSRAEEMVEAVQRADAAGIKSSVIVLLGLGGKERSREHVAGTIEALNKMQPRYLSFLSVMLIPDTELYKQARKGAFTELGPQEYLQETYDILNGLNMHKTIFRTDHASNYLALQGRLPHDKNKLLMSIYDGLSGRRKLRPELFRGL